MSSSSAARLRSIHVGQPERHGWLADHGGTSIRKRAVDGPVRATAAGLEGDRVAHPE